METLGRFVKGFFNTGNISATVKGGRLGKEITKTFLAALLAEGSRRQDHHRRLT